MSEFVSPWLGVAEDSAGRSVALCSPGACGFGIMGRLSTMDVLLDALQPESQPVRDEGRIISTLHADGVVPVAGSLSLERTSSVGLLAVLFEALNIDVDTGAEFNGQCLPLDTISESPSDAFEEINCHSPPEATVFLFPNAAAANPNEGRTASFGREDAIMGEDPTELRVHPLFGAISLPQLSELVPRSRQLDVRQQLFPKTLLKAGSLVEVIEIFMTDPTMKDGRHLMKPGAKGRLVGFDAQGNAEVHFEGIAATQWVLPRHVACLQPNAGCSEGNAQAAYTRQHGAFKKAAPDRLAPQDHFLDDAHEPPMSKCMQPGALRAALCGNPLHLNTAVDAERDSSSQPQISSCCQGQGALASPREASPRVVAASPRQAMRDTSPKLTQDYPAPLCKRPTIPIPLPSGGSSRQPSALPKHRTPRRDVSPPARRAILMSAVGSTHASRLPRRALSGIPPDELHEVGHVKDHDAAKAAKFTPILRSPRRVLAHAVVPATCSASDEVNDLDTVATLGGA